MQLPATYFAALQGSMYSSFLTLLLRITNYSTPITHRFVTMRCQDYHMALFSSAGCARG